MNWKRWSTAMSLGIVLMGSVFAGAAMAADAVLYEVTEAVASKGAPNSQSTAFRSSTATLSGVVSTGTAGCSAAIATPALQGCWVIVRAVGRANDDTGMGPIVGSFEVVVQDRNQVDSPEIVVLRGHVGGHIDLSPAFLQNRPIGTVSGSYTLHGVPGTVMSGQTHRGEFTGVFRLPYMNNGQAWYLGVGEDNNPVAVQNAEYVLGYPAVKLEITFR